MSEQFEAIFAHLRGVYAGYEKRCTVMADQPGKYYLGTHAVRAKDGYRTWFAVEIKKNYVSAHLVPVYACPDLLDAVSPQLRKRMQGNCWTSSRSWQRPARSGFARRDGSSVCDAARPPPAALP